jgi:hypothetical protein
VVYFKNNWASSYLNRASNMLLDASSPLKSKVEETTFHSMQREDDDQVNPLQALIYYLEYTSSTSTLI